MRKIVGQISKTIPMTAAATFPSPTLQ